MSEEHFVRQGLELFENIRLERDKLRELFDRLRDDYNILLGHYNQLKAVHRSVNAKLDHYMVSHTEMRNSMMNAAALLAEHVSRADQAPYLPIPLKHQEEQPVDLDDQKRLEDLAKKLAPDGQRDELGKLQAGAPSLVDGKR